MNRDTAIARIKEVLQQSIYDTDIQNHLMEVQEELERGIELPEFLVQEQESILGTANEERLPVPTDFLREREENSLYIFDSTATSVDDQWIQLLKQGRDKNIRLYPGTGRPRAYSLDGGYFRTRPVPDAIYTFKLIYYVKDDLLTNNIENRWLKNAHDLMIGLAGSRKAGIIRDKNAKAIFDAMAQAASRRVFGNMIANQLANRRVVMGGED